MRFIWILTILVVMSLPLPMSAQTSVTAIALFSDKAMLSIDGAKPKIVRAGGRYKGVTLVSSNTSEAVVEIAGKREVLILNGTTKFAGSEKNGSVVEIRVNSEGFFESQGAVNGQSIKFLVDTGASLVVFSSQQADAIGLSYQNGSIGYASTASGTAPMYNIQVDNISVGGIKLQNVGVGVIEGAFPEKPLLGMTFLRQVDMTRSGNLMTLKQR